MSPDEVIKTLGASRGFIYQRGESFFIFFLFPQGNFTLRPKLIVSIDCDNIVSNSITMVKLNIIYH